MKLSIKQKITAAIIAGVIMSISALLVMTIFQRSRIDQKIGHDLDAISQSHLQQIVADVRSNFEITNELLDRTLKNRINFGFYYLKLHGGLKLGNSTVKWEASNQVTKETVTLELPRMLIGNTWLGQISSFKSEPPVVDELKEIVGGDWTIFQRINDKGDMLRVATNVKNAEGDRGIGTFIPATNPNGSANPIIQAVLSGREYLGSAQVVDIFYPRTLYTPVRDNRDRVIGMLFVGAGQDIQQEIRDIVAKVKVGETGYVYVLGGKSELQKGHYIISQNNKRNGENIYDSQDAKGNYFIREIVQNATTSKSGTFHTIRYPWKNSTDAEARMKVAVYTYYEPWDWIIGAGMYEDEFYRAKNSANQSLLNLITWSVLAGLIILVLLSVVGYYFAAYLIRPVHRVSEMTRDIAQGEGDLTKRIQYNNQDEIGDLTKWFNVFVEKIQDIIKSVKSTMEQVSKASESIASASEQMASGAEEQQSQLSEIATSMEQMSAMILESSKNANDTQANAHQANQAANDGAQTVQETVGDIENVVLITNRASEQIATLENRSLEIGKVIQVIDDIADQTNLLALNANIEAARAGEAGRGFAVVADEVRKLAERTVKATAEIGDQIKSIQVAVNESVNAMNKVTERSKDSQKVASKAGDALDKISQLVNNVNQAISQVASAADEQSSGAEQISKNVETVSTVAKEAASSAQQLASSSEELNREVQKLERLVGQFKV